MARYSGKTRKSYGKKRRTLKKRHVAKAKKMRGGALKEDALATISENGYTMDQFITKLFREGEEKTAMGPYGEYSFSVLNLGDFTYKIQGSVSIAIFAKPIGADDAAYVRIHLFSDH